MKLKTPDLFFSPRVLILKDEVTKASQFEVYYVFNTETKDLLYIGSGKKGRHKHVFSGASQNVSLNACMICSVPLTVTVKGVASKEESLTLEAEEIKRLNPKFNGRFTSILDLTEIDVGDLGETMEILLSKEAPSLKAICELYEENPNLCKEKYPEWFQIIDALGMETVRKNSFRKGALKKAYESLITVNSAPLEVRIAKAFKVGEKYSSKEIKDILTRLDVPKAKAVFIKRWFEVKEVQVFKELIIASSANSNISSSEPA